MDEDEDDDDWEKIAEGGRGGQKKVLETTEVPLKVRVHSAPSEAHKPQGSWQGFACNRHHDC